MRLAGLPGLILFILLAPAPVLSSALDCATPDAEFRVTRDNHLLLARSHPTPPPVAAPFVLEILVCHDGAPAEGRLSFDARMPAHGHGMNYRPHLTRQRPGAVRIEGLLLHMPGFWEATLTLRTAERALRFRFPLRQP